MEVRGQVADAEEVFLYTAPSMVAEVGGYVGLFLGVSVNQVATRWSSFERRSKWRLLVISCLIPTISHA